MAESDAPTSQKVVVKGIDVDAVIKRIIQKPSPVNPGVVLIAFKEISDVHVGYLTQFLLDYCEDLRVAYVVQSTRASLEAIKRAQRKTRVIFERNETWGAYFKLIESSDLFQSAFSILGFTEQIRKLRKKKVNEKDIYDIVQSLIKNALTQFKSISHAEPSAPPLTPERVNLPNPNLLNTVPFKDDVLRDIVPRRAGVRTEPNSPEYCELTPEPPPRTDLVTRIVRTLEGSNNMQGQPFNYLAGANHLAPAGRGIIVNVHPFRGPKNRDIVDFLHGFENQCILAHVPREHWPIQLYQFMADEPLAYYEQLMRENAEAPLTWNNIKDRLHAKYSDRSLPQDYTLQMAERHFRPNETFTEYFNDKIRLIRLAFPAATEQNKILYLSAGMPEDQKQRIREHKHTFTNVEDVLVQAKEYKASASDANREIAAQKEEIKALSKQIEQLVKIVSESKD